MCSRSALATPEVARHRFEPAARQIARRKVVAHDGVERVDRARARAPCSGRAAAWTGSRSPRRADGAAQPAAGCGPDASRHAQSRARRIEERQIEAVQVVILDHVGIDRRAGARRTGARRSASSSSSCPRQIERLARPSRSRSAMRKMRSRSESSPVVSRSNCARAARRTPRSRKYVRPEATRYCSSGGSASTEAFAELAQVRERCAASAAARASQDGVSRAGARRRRAPDSGAHPAP